MEVGKDKAPPESSTASFWSSAALAVPVALSVPGRRSKVQSLVNAAFAPAMGYSQTRTESSSTSRHLALPQTERA
jgi:hypothetical protein